MFQCIYLLNWLSPQRTHMLRILASHWHPRFFWGHRKKKLNISDGAFIFQLNEQHIITKNSKRHLDSFGLWKHYANHTRCEQFNLWSLANADIQILVTVNVTAIKQKVFHCRGMLIIVQNLLEEVVLRCKRESKGRILIISYLLSWSRLYSQSLWWFLQCSLCNYFCFCTQSCWFVSKSENVQSVMVFFFRLRICSE